jgi:hypothetical protein
MYDLRWTGMGAQMGVQMQYRDEGMGALPSFTMQ